MGRFARYTGILAAALSLIVSPVAFAETQSKTVQVTATILPRLELSVEPATGPTIAFGAISQPADGQTAARSVAVSLRVFSNLDRPYHVTQLIRQPLTNTQGSAIPHEQFLLATRDASRGQLRVPQPISFVPGVPITLYESDARGKSDAFTAEYHLAVTPATPAGDFETTILYTVTSL